MTKARRYAQRWRGRVPSAPLTAQYLDSTAPQTVRLHRRIALGGHGLFLRALTIPLQACLELRWLSGEASREVALALSRSCVHYETATGMSRADQERGLRHLAMAHAVTPLEAYDFDLLGHPGDWSTYLFDREVGWNLSVSQPQAKPWAILLSDKFRTGQWLGRLGIPTPEAQLVEKSPDPDVEALAATWLDRWGAVVGKPRRGSGGDGLFELLPGSGSGFLMTHYQWNHPVDDPERQVGELLATSDYVVQPRLASHELFDDVADPRRVVVLRVVTRDVGSGPRVFSACVEVALPIVNGLPYVAYISVDAVGRMGDAAAPQWRRREPVAASQSAGPAMAQLRRATDVLRGLEVPGFQLAADCSLRAHSALPGLFAVAWDIAITPQGPIVLEGNTGFGTRVPQWISGGLLTGFRVP